MFMNHFNNIWVLISNANCHCICNHLSFIHSGYLYSTFSSPLLLRSAPDYSINTLSELTPEVLQKPVSEGLVQSAYVAAGVGFKLATLRTQVTELTHEPPRPI